MVKNRSVTLSQPIFDATLLPSLNASIYKSENAKISHQSSKQAVMLDVTSVYINAIVAFENIQLRKKYANTLDLRESIIQKAPSIHSKSDLTDIQRKKASNLVGINSAQHQLDMAILKLNHLTGLSIKRIDSLKRSPKTNQLPTKARKIPIDSLPDMHMVRNAAEITQAEYQQTLFSMAPTVNFNLNHSKRMPGVETNSASLSFNMPLSASSIADSMAAKQLVYGSRSNISHQHKQALIAQDTFITTDHHLRNTFTATQKSYTAFKKFADVEVKSYESGLIPLVQYLDALNDLTDEEIKVKEAFYKVWLNHFSTLAYQSQLKTTDIQKLSLHLTSFVLQT